MPTWPRRGAAAAVLTTLLVTTAVALGTPAAQAAPYTVSGIDIAGYQHPGYQGKCKGTDTDSIDWDAVAASGQQFAIIKATESTTCTNPYFATDRQQARRAGLVVGAYHFARPAYELSSATAQAKYFAKVIGDQSAPGTLPPVLDIESDGGLTKTRLAKWTQRFLDRIQEYTGRTPMIYSYGSFLDAEVGNLDSFARYPLWLARYRSTPPTGSEIPGAWSSWSIWQYTSSGKVPGIQGSVDVNWFGGTRTQLLALANGASVSAPDAPVDVVTAVDGADVKLAWSAPERDGGSAITTYSVSVDGVTDGYTPTRSYVAMNLSPGPHTFAVRAINGVGTGPAATTTVTVNAPVPGAAPPPAATTTNLSTATRVRTGATKTVEVTLRRADTQQTLGGRKVTVAAKPKSGTAPKPAKLVSDTAGRVRLPVRFRSHTTVTATFNGTQRLRPATASSYVRVEPVVTVSRSKGKIRKGDRVKVKARVDALYAGDKIVLQQRRKGVWRKHTNAKVSSTGRATFRPRTTATGTARYRVVIRSAHDHLASTSRTLKVKVRKPRR